VVDVCCLSYEREERASAGPLHRFRRHVRFSQTPADEGKLRNHSLAIAFFTWLGGQTLYNRFYLKRRGRDQFPFSSLHLPGFSRSGHTGPSLPGLGSFRRRSQRAGYSGIRAEENDEDEGFARRFSLEEDDEDAEDLTGQRVGALGEEANAWRGAPNGQANGVQQGKVGVHQGLVDV